MLKSAALKITLAPVISNLSKFKNLSAELQRVFCQYGVSPKGVFLDSGFEHASPSFVAVPGHGNEPPKVKLPEFEEIVRLASETETS